MIELYNQVSLKTSRVVTTKYSTSFTIGILLLDKSIRKHIYSIYGFVRLADEIVDSFHNHEQEYLLEKFEKDTFEAIEKRISLNPILHSFQMTVNEYNIDLNHIKSFLESMRMDLREIDYNEVEFQKYIYGSAQVVGLMCLQVYTNKNIDLYKDLIPYAISLGSAFQKVNFIRDLKADMKDLERSYFPNIELNNLDQNSKEQIEKDIEKDFIHSRIGICKLPKNSKSGVYTAYLYYLVLLKKIKNTKVEDLMNKRVRVSNFKKLLLLLKAKFDISLKRI